VSHPDFHVVIPYFVNFAITIGLLVMMVRKPLRRYVYQRHSHMKDSVEAAARAHEQALARNGAAKAALSAAGAEEQSLAATERKQAEQEKGEILEKARQEAERLAREAERMAANEQDEALEKVKAQFLNSVVQGAEQKLKQGLKKDDHLAIIKRAQNSIEVEA
jgi:F-type H+-transporting ATPase subunit b